MFSTFQRLTLSDQQQQFIVLLNNKRNSLIDYIQESSISEQ